jgi:hypothetical protein
MYHFIEKICRYQPPPEFLDLATTKGPGGIIAIGIFAVSQFVTAFGQGRPPKVPGVTVFNTP